MIDWLEQICAGELHTHWTVEEEGAAANFGFIVGGGNDWTDGLRGQLLYTLSDDEKMLCVSAIGVEARAVVVGFYGAFRTFVESDRYVPKQWESHAPLTYYAAEATEEEEDAALSGYSGERLRDLRSFAVEAYLAEPSENPQLALDLQWRPRDD